MARLQFWRIPAEGAIDIVTRYAAVMARYRPRPLAIPAIFYSAAYDGRGWRGLFPDLQIVRIPGGHMESVTDQVADLANHLRAKFRELDRAAPQTVDRHLIRRSPG